MAGKKIVQLRLPDTYVGQMVDGLEVLTEQWEQTAEFMEDEDLEGEDIVIRECSGTLEARSIAGFYRRILSAIREQA